MSLMSSMCLFLVNKIKCVTNELQVPHVNTRLYSINTISLKFMNCLLTCSSTGGIVHTYSSRIRQYVSYLKILYMLNILPFSCTHLQAQQVLEEKKEKRQNKDNIRISQATVLLNC